MSYDYRLLPHEGIQTLSPYIPGKSIDSVCREYGLNHVIKLASNENPLGCSPHVLERLREITPSLLATYPAPLEAPLNGQLAEINHVSTAHITLSNGSDPLFPLLMTCFALHRGKDVLTHEHAFMSYAIQAKTLGIPLKITSMLPNWQIDIQQIIEKTTEKTALIFIANPNNPTGGFSSEHQIRQILNAIPEKTLLVLDEAYHEYLTHSSFNSMGLIHDYPNLVITRTFSKAYGLAGLRLGYAIAHPSISALLKKAMQPFTVNTLSLIAASAALEDPLFLQQTIALNQSSIHFIKTSLEKANFTYLPITANFITFDYQKDATLGFTNLLKQGIITRPLHAFGLPHHIRISSGTMADSQRLGEALLTC